MEVKEVTQPTSYDAMIFEDSSAKAQDLSSYCPDFSDIQDDNYEFWDFLSSKKEMKKKLKENADESCCKKGESCFKNGKFWDFLGSSTNEEVQSITIQKDYELIGSSDSGIYTESEFDVSVAQLYSDVQSISETAATQPKICSKSNSCQQKSSIPDDEFWDFLKCTSPVLTFQEALLQCDSALANKEEDGTSFLSRNEESPLASVSEYSESGRYSNLGNSRPYVHLNTNHNVSREKNCGDFNSAGSSKNRCDGKYNEHFNHTDFTNYSAVLRYLNQDCNTNDCVEDWPEVGNSSIDRMNTEYNFTGTNKMPQAVVDEYSPSNFIEASPHESRTKENEESLNLLFCAENKLDNFIKTNCKDEDLKTRVSSSNSLKQDIVSSASLFRNVHHTGNSHMSLPCITSVFSMRAEPDALKKTEKPNRTNPNRGSTQGSGKIRQRICKRQLDFFKESNPPACRIPGGNSQFSMIGGSINPVSNLSNINSVNLEAKNTQTFQGHGSFIHCNIQNDGTSSRKINVNPTVSSSTTHSVPVVVNNTGINNSTSHSSPLYLVLPPNSQSLQDPNYSHYFVILNNAQSNQPTCSKTSVVAAKTNNLKCAPAQQNQTSISQSSLSTAVSSAVTSHHSFLLNAAKGNNQNQVKSGSISSIPTKICSSTANLFLNSATSNEIPCTLVQDFSPVEPTRTLNFEARSKMVHQKFKHASTKPIKNISLGKDKYAIQQISIPTKIENTPCDKDAFNAQENCMNLFKTNDNFLNGNEFCGNTSKESLHSNSKATINIANSSNSSIITSATFNLMKPKTNNPSTNFVSTMTSRVKPAIYSIHKNVNAVTPSQTTLAVNTESLNINAVPFSERLQVNRSISTAYAADKMNSNKDTLNLNTSNNFVQIKVAPSQDKSLAALQELFPPPISMVPVCIMPPTQSANPTTTSNVLILKGPRHQQVISNKLPIHPIASRQRLSYKKEAVKFRKIGRKTVRELLEERRKIISGKLCNSNKLRKEIRVLRPILKLPTCNKVVCPSLQSESVSDNSELNVSSNMSNLSSAVSSSKRPNILLLPSSSKSAKKNILDDRRDASMIEQELEYNSSIFETLEENLSSPCSSSTLSKKNSRPRHYDMSGLQIGFFKVNDDIDSCGRFRSKFKVIFSKRQFLYDFPVSRCNQISLKSSQIWEQMVRIVVPFKTVVSMNLSERNIHISINSPPFIYLGRLQARSGIIANAIIYDTPIENESAWSDGIRSYFNHKIILRKRQAGKLRSFLCLFDERFDTLTSLGICGSEINNASEVSVFDGELSPTSLKKNFMKNKKSIIRRLPQWDSPVNEEESELNEGELLLLNLMCSCRISCRSVRCSCVKAAKCCSSICTCINCDNPLNILESIGLNLEFSLSDSCLFQNIYQLPKLMNFLSKEVKLSCCNTFARIKDCIPGTVLCPNVDCNVQLEFSWCRWEVCYPERNPRNHCSFCGQCCFSNGRHCMSCNRCYVVSSKSPHCPTCRDKTATNCITMKDIETKEQKVYSIEDYEDPKVASKSGQKPEIILLDASSVQKFSGCSESGDRSSNREEESENYATNTDQL